MRDVKLTTVFLLGTISIGLPLAFGMLFLSWLLFQDTSYVEFMSSNSKATQYSALLSTMVSVIVSTRLSLNFTVRVNAKFKWYSEAALREKIGHELQRWVFVKYT